MTIFQMGTILTKLLLTKENKKENIKTHEYNSYPFLR